MCSDYCSVVGMWRFLWAYFFCSTGHVVPVWYVIIDRWPKHALGWRHAVHGILVQGIAALEFDTMEGICTLCQAHHFGPVLLDIDESLHCLGRPIFSGLHESRSYEFRDAIE